MVEVGSGGQEKGGPPSMTVTEEEKEGSKVGSNSIQPYKEYLRDTGTF